MIYIGADILIKAIAFVSMPFFLHRMTPDDFGQFNLYLTYSSIFVVFFGLNVANSIVRYYVERAESKKYLATAIWIVVFSGSISSGLILGFHYYFGFFALESKILIILLITTIFSSLANIGREVIRSEKNAILYGVLSILNSFISTSLGLIFIYTMKNDLAFWRLLSICISSITIGGLLTIRLMYKDGVKGNFKTAKYLLSYSIPLIPYTLSTTVLAHANKLFLAKINLAEVGIYSFAANLAMIVYIIAIALNRSLQPYLFEAIRDNEDYKQKIKRSFGIFYFFYIGFVFGTDILIWIFGNDVYLESAKVIPILILGYGYFFLYSLYINFLYYYKKNFIVSLFSVLCAGIAIVSNLILIKPYGYCGAAFSNLISYFALFVFGSVYVTKRLKISLFSRKTLFIIQVMLIFPVIIRILI